MRAGDVVLVQIFSEMAECAVYYEVSATCVGKSADPQFQAVADNMRKASAKLLALSLQLGAPSGKTRDGLDAQMFKGMKASINGSCSNTAILLDRYAD